MPVYGAALYFNVFLIILDILDGLKVIDLFTFYIISGCVQPCGLYPTRLLCPWDSPDKSTGVGFHFFASDFERPDLSLSIIQEVLVVENLPANAGVIGDTGSIPGSGGGHDTPLQYSCLENPMDRGAWWATVHGDHKSQT